MKLHLLNKYFTFLNNYTLKLYLLKTNSLSLLSLSLKYVKRGKRDIFVIQKIISRYSENLSLVTRYIKSSPNETNAAKHYMRVKSSLVPNIYLARICF